MRRIADGIWAPSRSSLFEKMEKLVRADAPLNHDKTGPDISRADFTWCMTAISWGHSIEATAAREAALDAVADELYSSDN